MDDAAMRTWMRAQEALNRRCRDTIALVMRRLITLRVRMETMEARVEALVDAGVDMLEQLTDAVEGQAREEVEHGA